MINPEVKADNDAMLRGLVSDDAYLRKEATENVKNFLRIRAREDAAFRKIIPPIGVTRDDLDKQRSTAKPCIIKDKEPNSHSAVSVPFGTAPVNETMDAPRYMITFHRILTRRYRADVMDLLTYDLDIREIFNDLMLKDVLQEEDRKWLAACDVAVGSLNASSSTRVTATGAMGYITVGSLNRTSLANARTGLAETDNHLPMAISLINSSTVWKVVALGRDTIGGDAAERMFFNGLTDERIMDLDWVVTIKHDLVPNNIQYMFTSPDALGDFFTLEDLTVWSKHEAYMFEMFAYETLGGIVGNTAGVCKVSYSGSFSGWRPSSSSSS